MMRSLITLTQAQRPDDGSAQHHQYQQQKPAPRRVPIVKKLSSIEKLLNEDLICYFILGLRSGRWLAAIHSSAARAMRSLFQYTSSPPLPSMRLKTRDSTNIKSDKRFR